ncbi:hypothetical protein DRQ33_00750 [bacterium]|nr:MAG: hypothetical protein DRQ33_00750 [bacterium]
MNNRFIVITLIVIASICIAQPTDTVEYIHWKNSVGGGAKSTMLLGPIQNEYVAVQLDNVDEDERGCFNIGTSTLYSPRPDETLLFNYDSDPWSSHAVFKVDDSYYSYSDAPHDPPGPPTVLTSTASGHSFVIRDTVIDIPYPLTGEMIPDTTEYIHGGWLAGGLLIMQNLAPIHVYGDVYTAIDWPGTVPPESLFSPTFLSTHIADMVDTTGTIMIQYIIENPDASSHDVGILLEMDTMIGGNDAAPLATSYGYAAVEQEFLASDVMPEVWYAGEDDPPWDPSVLVAQGFLSSRLEAVTPDRFLVGSWGTYDNVTWDYTPTFGTYWDSAVLIYWFPRTIPPGGSLVFNTYYGLKLPEREIPTVNIISPPEMTLTACPGQPIEIVCTDELGVDTTNFAVSINGNILVYPDHMTATWVGSLMTSITFHIQPPEGYYTSCETVRVVAFARDFFENISHPDTLLFTTDLIGPEVVSFSISDFDTLGLTDPISATVQDDCSGIDSSSILVGLVGVLTGAHTFAIGDGSVLYNSSTGEINFDPTGIGFYYMYDDSIVFGISRCADNVSEEYCGPNPIQDNSVIFYTPDNDTVPPEVFAYDPIFMTAGTPFPIQVIFHDQAGVDTCSPSYIYDGSGPYPNTMDPYLIWDDDGELDINYAGRLDLVAIDETTFTTAGVGMVPAHPGGSEIVFRVYAYDNDFSRNRIEDALPVRENFQTIPITEAPTATLESPPESSITSCEDQVIVIAIHCSTEVEADSIELYVNGTPYDTSSDQLIFIPSTNTLEFHPSGAAIFSDGAVQIELQGLYDIYGTPGITYNWTFFTDLTPPQLSNEIPSQGSEVADISFDISFTLQDIGPIPEATAGLDTSSVQAWVSNNEGTFDVTTYISNVGNLFTLNTATAGLSFLDNEIITVRVRAGDDIEVMEYCDQGSNILDTTWTFSMSETPCHRGTNPITPALEDGFNDWTLFQFPNMRSDKLDKKIYIYDRYEHLVRTIENPDEDGWKWNGKDDNEQFVPQGLYIYIIVVDGEAVCNGTISVAR